MLWYLLEVPRSPQHTFSCRNKKNIPLPYLQLCCVEQCPHSPRKLLMSITTQVHWNAEIAFAAENILTLSASWHICKLSLLPAIVKPFDNSHLWDGICSCLLTSINQHTENQHVWYKSNQWNTTYLEHMFSRRKQSQQKIITELSLKHFSLTSPMKLWNRFWFNDKKKSKF